MRPNLAPAGDTDIRGRDRDGIDKTTRSHRAELLGETLAQVRHLTPRPQHNQNATFAPLLKKEDGLIKEMDELFTFVGSKKQAYVVTIVDRASRCVVA